MSKQALLTKLIEPAVKALGFELWGIEFFAQSKRQLLRIYIDGPNGINVDDCAAVSHQVSGILELEDPIAGEYVLEVSSPGLDRPLFKPSQYERYIGEQLKVRLKVPYEGRRKFSGVLTAIENDEIVLHEGDSEYLLPFETIDKAHIVAKI